METRKQTTIFDLDYDVLKHILLVVAKSPDGALSLARTLPVCKLFMKLADDEEVVKAVAFDNLNMFGRMKLFHQYKGLLTRCALAGNASAEYLLAKIMLVSCMMRVRETKLESGAISSASQERFDRISKYLSETSSFMAHFGINTAPSSEDNPWHSICYQLVRSCLCRCKPTDGFFELYFYMEGYFMHDIKRKGHFILMDVIKKMSDSCARLKDVEAIRSILEGLVCEKIGTFGQLQQEGMGKNSEYNFEIILQRYRDLFRSSPLKMECAKRGFKYGSILRGNLEQLNAARRAAVAGFEKHRARAISVVDSILSNSCVMPYYGERRDVPRPGLFRQKLL